MCMKKALIQHPLKFISDEALPLAAHLLLFKAAHLFEHRSSTTIAETGRLEAPVDPVTLKAKGRAGAVLEGKRRNVVPLVLCTTGP